MRTVWIKCNHSNLDTSSRPGGLAFVATAPSSKATDSSACSVTAITRNRASERRNPSMNSIASGKAGFTMRRSRLSSSSRRNALALGFLALGQTAGVVERPA